jgi:hypothetical protein
MKLPNTVKMNNYHYFRCNWIITPLNYELFKRLQHTLQLLRASILSGTLTQDEHGIWISHIIIKVDTAQAFERFQHEIGSEIGMTDWVEVSEAEFLDGNTSLMTSAVPDFLLLTQKLGKENKSILDSIAGNLGVL